MKKDPGAKPSLATGGPGEIRVGPALAIPVLLAEFGVSPQSAFAQAGVDQQLFGAKVVFEAEVSGLLFASSWLDRPIQGADPALYALVAAAIREAEAKVPMRLADHVALVLPQIVLSGMASGEVVARLFAIHPRTLRRRLEREGKSLRALITEARFELAKQLLQNTALSVAAIAAALHYEDSNAFSRAFRSWSKRSPMQWRAGA